MRDEARRLLRLEFLEDRTLPAGAWPTVPTQSSTDTSAGDGADPDAAEYGSNQPSADSADATSSGSAAKDQPTSPGNPGTAYRAAADNAAAAEYRAPRADVAAFAPPPPAVVPAAAPAAPAPVSSVPQPEPPPTPTPTPTAAPAPIAVGHPAVESVEPPAPNPATEDKPAEGPTVVPVPVAAEPDSASSAGSPLTRLADELAVRVDLPATWDEAAARLLDGLAVAAETADPGPNWAGVGYWAVTVAAVGVAVELARQATRARRPDPDCGDPSLLVVRR